VTTEKPYNTKQAIFFYATPCFDKPTPASQLPDNPEDFSSRSNNSYSILVRYSRAKPTVFPPGGSISLKLPQYSKNQLL
jgi:hypothetical protein